MSGPLVERLLSCRFDAVTISIDRADEREDDADLVTVVRGLRDGNFLGPFPVEATSTNESSQRKLVLAMRQRCDLARGDLLERDPILISLLENT